MNRTERVAKWLDERDERIRLIGHDSHTEDDATELLAQIDGEQEALVNLAKEVRHFLVFLKTHEEKYGAISGLDVVAHLQAHSEAAEAILKESEVRDEQD